MTSEVNAINTPERVIAEIEASLSKSNPNIGSINSVLMKNGPKAFKVATLLQILNATTNEHHHFSLNLETWHKKSGLFTFQEKQKITIDDDDKTDEIEVLITFVNEFKRERSNEVGKYGVITQSDYDKFDKFSKSDSSIKAIDILEDDSLYNDLLKSGGSQLLKNSVEWAVSSDNCSEVVEKLKELSAEKLKGISTILGLSQIKKVIQIWNENNKNDDEEFWQRVLFDYSWVLSQTFSLPIIFFDDKSYVGGKSIKNKSGNVIDFIHKNELTNNVLLIEIKTPSTKLIGSKYRNTYSPSSELSGSVNQILNYKRTLQNEYNTISNNSDDSFYVFNPKSLLVIGSISETGLEPSQVEAFEMYRNNSKDIEIITFDELFGKVKSLLNLLELGVSNVEKDK